MLRWLTAGESHGPALVAILEGMPAGVGVTTAEIAEQLRRRRLGVGRGARMKFEADEVTILGGVRHGLTLGSPISLQVANTEWPKWEQVMSADPVDAEELEGLARNSPLTRPRPRHAVIAGLQKYGVADARPFRARASARGTAARVAVGSVARAFLHDGAGVTILSHVVRIGGASIEIPPPAADRAHAIDEDPVRCADENGSQAMQEEISAAHRDGDTLGGVIEVVVHGLPPGLGSHVHWDRRIDARIAAALMGIQAMKGVEFGDGFGLAEIRGSAAQDEIVTADAGLRRTSGHSGGSEGGMTTGEVLRVRAAMKPISTIPRALDTVDVATGEAAKAINQRSDVCAVPASGVVAEAMVALTLADAVVEKFGGDHVSETRRNLESYLAHLAIR